jgi:hypothetical protein
VTYEPGAAGDSNPRRRPVSRSRFPDQPTRATP